MAMLIFLDIDGVMVPAKSWQSPELLNDGFPAFSLKAVHVLQNLISEDTTVMLTTSHKTRFTIEQWKEIFQKRGLQIVKLKSLEDNINCQSRKDEVLNWFNLNNVSEEFIIIDDDKSLNGLPTHLKDKLILTSPLIGLTDIHLKEINALLSQKSQMA